MRKHQDDERKRLTIQQKEVSEEIQNIQSKLLLRIAKKVGKNIENTACKEYEDARKMQRNNKRNAVLYRVDNEDFFNDTHAEDDTLDELVLSNGGRTPEMVE